MLRVIKGTEDSDDALVGTRAKINGLAAVLGASSIGFCVTIIEQNFDQLLDTTVLKMVAFGLIACLVLGLVLIQ